MQLDVDTWLAAPAHMHHACALMSSVVNALINGSMIATSSDRRHLHAAVSEMVQRLVPLLATDADYDRYGPVSDDDAALLRLTAALCLMRIGTCADQFLPAYAYVELALVMHDGSADVRPPPLLRRHPWLTQPPRFNPLTAHCIRGAIHFRIPLRQVRAAVPRRQ